MEENIYEQSESSNMYEEVVPSDNNQKKIKVISRLTDKIERGDDVIDVASDLDKSAEQIDMEVLEEGTDTKIKTLSSLLSKVSATRKDFLEPIAAKILETDLPVDTLTKSELEKHKALVEATTNSHLLTKKEIIDNAIINASKEYIAKQLDDDIFGKVIDFAELMIIDDTFVNHANMKDAISGEEKGKDYLNTQGAVKDIVSFGLKLPPEQRLQYNKFIIDYYFKELDHNKILAFLNSLEAIGATPSVDVAIDDFFNKAFIAAGVANIPKFMLNGFSKMNAIRRAVEQKQLDAAAILQKTAKNPEVAKELGISEVDAASFGNPLVGGDDLNHAIPDKDKAEILLRLQDVDKSLKKAEDILDVDVFATEAERTYIAQAVARKFGKDPLIENVRADVSSDGKGVNVTYDLLSESGNEVSTISKTIPFKYDDLGGMIEDGVNLGLEVIPLSEIIASPRAILGKDKVTFVEQLEANMMARSKKTSAYAEAFGAALKGLKTNSKKKINNVLQTLEGKDVELTYDLLVNKGVGGVRLTPKEYSSVLGIRRVYDGLWMDNNKAIRQELIRKGMKGVEIDGIEQVVKVHEDSVGALATLRGARESGEDWIYLNDDVDSKVLRFDENFVKDKINSDYVLVDANRTSAYDWFTVDLDTKVRYALVPKDKIRELPEVVLSKTPNYIPRRRKDSNFFIKEMKEVTIGGAGGKVVKVPRTVAWASTRKQAEMWVEKASKLSDEVEGTASSYTIKADREFFGSAEHEEDVIRSFGGQYTGARSSSGLEYAGDAHDAAMYINPLDTLQHAIQNTADRVTMSAWRQANKTRWYNQASIYESSIYKTPFNEAVGVIENSNIPASAKKQLIAAHKQISFNSGVPTYSEQQLQGVFRGIASAADRHGMESFAKYMYRIQDNNPIGLMRSAAYHTTLGFFSLVQFPVQLAGAVVALSVSPKSAPKALAHWLSASVLDLSDNSKTISKTLKILGKKMDLGDWEKDYKLWQRSGYKDSIRFANADTAAVLDKAPYDAGLLRRTYNRFLEIGEAPYKAGELANMRISFFTALEDIKKTAPNFSYSDADLRRVIARAERMRLNMSAANKAEFQKGLLSIPAQFKQIFTKFSETLLIGEGRGGFTKTERIRIGATQVGLFGAAGVPIVSGLVDKMASWYIEDGKEVSVEEMATIRRGVLGLLINVYADVDAAFSGRLTTSSDLIGEIKKAFTEDAPLYQTFGGVFASSADKWIDSVMMLLTAGKIVYDEPLDGASYQLALETVKTSLLNISASGRKFLEATFMKENGFMRAGSKTIRLESGDKGVEDIIARYVGFSSQKAADYWTFKKEDREYQEALQEVGKFYGTLLRDALIGDTSDNSRMNIYTRIMGEVMTEIKNLPIDDQLKVMRSVDRYLDSDTFEGTTFMKWMELQNNQAASSTSKTNIIGLQMLNKTKKEDEE